MTLLELLRRELPKRGGWPEGVRYITQDNGFSTYKGTICGYNSLPEFNSRIWVSDKPSRHADVVIMRTDDIADDHATAIVTREQYGWDGTGLPPVGVECEVSVDGGRSWCTYKAINEKNGARLIEIGNFTEEFQNNNWIFHPLRTEAERAIDEMVQLSGVSIGAAKILYDAGYRKG